MVRKDTKKIYDNFIMELRGGNMTKNKLYDLFIPDSDDLNYKIKSKLIKKKIDNAINDENSDTYKIYYFLYRTLKKYNNVYKQKKLDITDEKQKEFLEYQEECIKDNEEYLELLKLKEQELILREQRIENEERRLHVKEKNLKYRLNKLNNRQTFDEKDSNKEFVTFFRQHLKITNNITDTLSKRDISKYFENINKSYKYNKEDLYEFINNKAKTKWKTYGKWCYLSFLN